MAKKNTNEASLPTTLPVAEGETPWTAAEIAEQRVELLEELERAQRKIDIAYGELDDLLQAGVSGAGRDPADVGSSNFERDQELSLAHNAREMAEQIRQALRLFDRGDYGRCEVCEQPIGKGRLQVFPRATLCVTCKQREERR